MDEESDYDDEYIANEIGKSKPKKEPELTIPS
jgi:hypothetical protein